MTTPSSPATRATQRRRGEKVINATVGALLEDDGSPRGAPVGDRGYPRRGRPREGRGLRAGSRGAGVLREVTRDLPAAGPASRTWQCRARRPAGRKRAAARGVGRSWSAPVGGDLVVPLGPPRHHHLRRAPSGVVTFNMFREDGASTPSALEPDRGRDGRAPGAGCSSSSTTPRHNPTGASMTRSEWRPSPLLSSRRRQGALPAVLFADVAYLATAGRDQRPSSRTRALAAERALPSLLRGRAARSSPSTPASASKVRSACTADRQRPAPSSARSSGACCRGTWSNR